MEAGEWRVQGKRIIPRDTGQKTAAMSNQISAITGVTAAIYESYLRDA